MRGREETQPLKISGILYISSLLSNSIPPSCESNIHPLVSVQSSIHPSNPNMPLCPGADIGHWRYTVWDNATVVPALMKFLALTANWGHIVKEGSIALLPRKDIPGILSTQNSLTLK